MGARLRKHACPRYSGETFTSDSLESLTHGGKALSRELILASGGVLK